MTCDLSNCWLRDDDDDDDYDDGASWEHFCASIEVSQLQFWAGQRADAPPISCGDVKLLGRRMTSPQEVASAVLRSSS